jgi:hypothetical protein
LSEQIRLQTPDGTVTLFVSDEPTPRQREQLEEWSDIVLAPAGAVTRYSRRVSERVPTLALATRERDFPRSAEKLFPDAVEFLREHQISVRVTRDRTRSPDQLHTMIEAAKRSVVDETTSRFGGFLDTTWPAHVGVAGLIDLAEDGGHLIPAFQIGESDVRPVVAATNEHLGASDDPWGALSWWVRGNAWLQTEPVTLVGTTREPEIVAAVVELLAVVW